MTDTTYQQAVNLKTTLNYLNSIKAELANAATQNVIVLKRRPGQPNPPPSALTDSLSASESFLLAQAVTEIQSQIDSLQSQFDLLHDES